MDMKRIRKLDLAFDLYDEWLSDESQEAYSHGVPLDFTTWLHRQYKMARTDKTKEEKK